MAMPQNRNVRNPLDPNAESQDAIAAREARERAAAVEREVAAMRAQEEARRQSTAEITSDLPPVTLERFGSTEEQAQRAVLARQLMTQQQAAQRQLAQQQARAGIRGGAATAQQARFAKQLEAERSQQEEAGFMGRRQFNIQQGQQEQFARVASELAKRQLLSSLRGQDLSLQAAKEYGQKQVEAARAQGKIICTELHRQGLLENDVMAADQDFGRLVSKYEPNVMAGYIILATPIVKLMRKSKLFTKMVALIARPWAHHMAYRMSVKEHDNAFGRIVMDLGIPFCRFIGERKKHAAAN